MTKRIGALGFCLSLTLLGFLGCAGMTAPDPILRPALPHTWAVPTSQLTLPIQIPFSQIKAWTETAVPATLQGQGSGTKTLQAWFLRHDWNYWWDYEFQRTPLSLGFDGQRIRVGTLLSGSLAVRWDTIPGNLRSDVQATAGVEADWAITSDWKIVPSTRVYFQVLRADVPIGITWNGRFYGETLSIAQPLQQSIAPSLESLRRDLERQWAAFDLRAAVERAWLELQTPQPVPGAQQLWFALGPKTVALGPVVSSSEGLIFTLGLTAQPSLGPRPAVPRLPLPAAEPFVDSPAQINLALPIAMPWAEATRLLLEQLPEREIGGDGGKLRIQSLRAATDADRILLRIEGTAMPSWPGTPVSVVLWLSARPRWDPDTRILRLTEAQWNLKTQGFLEQTATWLLGDTWTKNWERSLVWELGPHLDQMRTQAATALASVPLTSYLSLRVGLDQWSVDDFALTDEGLELLARIEGTATVAWQR